MIYPASFNHVSEGIIDVWRYDNYSFIYRNSSWCDGGQTQHFSIYWYCICLTVNKLNEFQTVTTCYKARDMVNLKGNKQLKES